MVLTIEEAAERLGINVESLKQAVHLLRIKRRSDGLFDEQVVEDYKQRREETGWKRRRKREWEKRQAAAHGHHTDHRTSESDTSRPIDTNAG